MSKAREDLRGKRNSDKDKVAKEEEAKERIRPDLMAAATTKSKRIKRHNNSAEEEIWSDSEDAPRLKTKRRKVQVSRMRGECSISADQN